jgi:fructoselysine-6-P-deglycase FrlB-like protein
MFKCAFLGCGGSLIGLKMIQKFTQHISTNHLLSSISFWEFIKVH